MIIARKAEFDSDFVEEELVRAGVAPPARLWADSVKEAKATWSSRGRGKYKIDALRESQLGKIGHLFGQKHGVSGDIKTLCHLLDFMYAEDDESATQNLLDNARSLQVMASMNTNP